MMQKKAHLRREHKPKKKYELKKSLNSMAPGVATAKEEEKEGEELGSEESSEGEDVKMKKEEAPEKSAFAEAP